MTYGGPAPDYAGSPAAPLEKIQFLLGHASVQRHLVGKQEFHLPVNEKLGMGVT
jgi:hypothetical protein